MDSARYREADARLRERREEWRREEMVLMAARDTRLRQLVGTQRGGVSRTARELGVSDSQIIRLLDEGLGRAARSALDHAGVPRGAYRITRQRGGRTIGIVPVGEALEARIVEALRITQLLVVERRTLTDVTMSETDRWKVARAVRATVREALDRGGISPQTYQLACQRGDLTCRVTATSVVRSLLSQALEQMSSVVRATGLEVELEVDQEDVWSLRVGAVGADQDGTPGLELVVGWKEEEEDA